MKKIVVFLSVICFFLLFSCQSVPQDNASIEQNSVSENSVVYKKSEGKYDGKYDDWKYRGFGYDVPEWAEPALKKNAAGVKRCLDELNQQEIVLFVQEGRNLDQAEALIYEKAEAHGEELEHFLDFWVKKSRAKKYTVVMIFVKK